MSTHVDSSVYLSLLFLIAASVALGCGKSNSGGSPEQGVGAAFVVPGSDTVILFNTDGERYVEFDRTTGRFSDSDETEDLGDDNPFDEVGAGSALPGGTEAVVFNETGSRGSVYDTATGDFSAPATFAAMYPGAPFARPSAGFITGDQVIFFDERGENYAAYNFVTSTWSNVFSFATEFGGGGAPFPAVGASFAFEAGGSEFYLFDRSGERFVIFDGGGVFSALMSLSDLGDGSLEF